MDRFPPPHPIYPPVIHYGPAPIPLRKDPHIPLTPKTGMRREEIERRLSEIDVTPEEKAAWNAKYQKPSTGIPKTDLASGVQASLAKADTALQEHQSLDGYATEEWVEDHGYLTQHQSLSAYRTATAQDAIDGALEAAIAAKYTKPATGIPASDLAASVQSALSDSRTPTQHASTHRSDGADPLDGSMIEVGGTGTYATAGIDTAIESIDTEIGNINTSLSGKVDSSDLATVATTGDYGDLLNKPTIPAAQVNADWNASSGVAQILNKPTIPDVSGKADSAAIAPAFSASSTYAVGDYVTHDGLLYKCTTAVSTAGAWNAANWSAVAVVDEMGADTPLPFDAEVEYIECSNVSTYLDFYINSLYDLEMEVYLPNGTASTDTAMLGRWTNSHSHLISAANSKFNVYYGGTSTTSINNAPPTGSWFTMSLQGSVASCNGQTTTVTRKYDTDGASKMMIIATNDARIRRARISYGPHDLMDLHPVRVGSTAYFYDSARGILVGIDAGAATPGPDKATPTITTPGRIVELTDSPEFTGTPTAPTAAAGTNTTQIATTAFVQDAVRYSFASPTPSVSGTAATVACEDRAINDFTVATGITSLTITPPAAVTGRARDFFCRVTITDASLSTVTLSGGTIDIGSTEVAGMTQGVNLLMFTEIASGHWLASRRSAS